MLDHRLWNQARERVLERDQRRCTVSRLLAGRCHGVLDVHHIEPVSEGGAPYEDDNLMTACHRHHPMVEALRRHVLASRRRECDEAPRCPHTHRTIEAREICEAQLARRARRRRRSLVSA